MTIFNSRKSGRNSGLEWIFTAFVVISAFNSFGVGINSFIFYIYKRSTKVSYRLARNRGKTTEVPALHKAVPVYTGDKDDVFMEEEISAQCRTRWNQCSYPHRCQTATESIQTNQFSLCSTKISRFYYIICRVILVNKLSPV